MSQVQLSPELARGLLQLARALLIATRNWSLYPPEHPAVGASVVRLADAVRQSSLGAIFSIGITPDTLLIEGAPADAGQTIIAEAAAMLHDRDLLQITFLGDPPPEGLHAFLRVLTLDAAERKRRGGPARIWQTEGHPSLVLDQIDYEKMLSRNEGDTPEPARRDDLWKAIVMSIAGGQKAVFDERAQQRLLSIAGSPLDISDLATSVMAPKCTLDGSPMITSQAATVLAAFRYLTGIVSVMSPERLPEVMSNLATAAVQLDPHVIMQVMQSGGVAVVGGLAAAFDDSKVAQLLATALALDGRASDRLATIFNTIAPDEDRKRRVLTLTRHLISETDFGRAGQFQALWTSMEELLVSYNDKPFVSDVYRSALDGVGGRAERMAVVDLPPELADWMESLGQASVRTLSVRLLIDLLTIERDAARAAEIAEDMVALSEDCSARGAHGPAGRGTRGGAPCPRPPRRVAGPARDRRSPRRRRRRRLGRYQRDLPHDRRIERRSPQARDHGRDRKPRSGESRDAHRRLRARRGDPARVAGRGPALVRAGGRRQAARAHARAVGGSPAPAAATEDRPARRTRRDCRARQHRRPVRGAGQLRQQLAGAAAEHHRG